MTWMNKAAGRFPLYLSGARGSRVTDIDGHDYVDFALGDTGAMAGHSPQPVVAAIQARVEQHRRPDGDDADRQRRVGRGRSSSAGSECRAGRSR